MNETSKITRIWIALALIWTALIFPGIVASFQVIEALPRKGFLDALYSTALGWFLQPGPGLLLTGSVLGVLVLLTLATGIASLRQHTSRGSKALRRYLRAVLNENQGLNPTGIAQPSQALISVNVPLDAIFIHLRAVSDRPLHDMPFEQQKALEELRQRLDLGAEGSEDNEEHIARLKSVWASQLGQSAAELRHKQNMTIEDVMRDLTAKNPVAVLLGVPGSGKSTTVRWLALRMAQTRSQPVVARWLHTLKDIFSTRLLRKPSSAPPSGLTLRLIPILFRISDYARRLSRPDADDLSFQEFFTEHLAKKYPKLPGLAKRLLGEMQKGHCLLLFDGLDEVASDTLRRRIATAIFKFISDSAPEEATARHYNRFIVTSRIVGYEPGPFTACAVYTLLDLEDKQIEEFLGHWCPTVERYMMSAANSRKDLTAQQQEEADRLGAEQREKLLTALSDSPGIKRLAVNPLMLTILALIQRSGRTLPHRRIELYQMVTRTLLDNWNREKGSRVFPPEHLPLAEQMLADLAYALHTSDRMLTERDVKIIACAAMRLFPLR